MPIRADIKTFKGKPPKQLAFTYDMYNALTDVAERTYGRIVINDDMMDMLDEIIPGLKKTIIDKTSSLDKASAIRVQSAFFQEFVTFLSSMAMLYKEKYFDQDIMEKQEFLKDTIFKIHDAFLVRRDRVMNRFNISSEEFDVMIDIMKDIEINLVLPG